jgi:hypothetical protein
MAQAKTPKFMGGMDFRDIKLFNQAMLARQCWRLLTDSESLCAKVLKVMYFPNGFFLDSTITRSCSFAWRSLMFDKDLLIKGIMWRIRDRDTVRITRDIWVLGALCHPIKPIVYILDNLRVSALINKATRQWNQELIEVYFSPPDAELILKIPLSSSLVVDCVSWPFTKTVIFYS